MSSSERICVFLVPSSREQDTYLVFIITIIFVPRNKRSADLSYRPADRVTGLRHESARPVLAIVEECLVPGLGHAVSEGEHREAANCSAPVQAVSAGSYSL